MQQILIVEDVPENLAFLARAVVKLGYRAVAVGTAGRALAALGLAMPSQVETSPAAADAVGCAAVLLDVRLPDMDGLQLVRHIRAQGLRDLPVIAVTAMALAGDREACLTAGMNDYLAKPVTVSQIREVLERWVGEPE